ncbi:MAG: ribulose bisphosphate carboxylase small subunit [Betaproteobacteria bacterium]|nr:ribulose bisphosphate carboxylase small subunit [Betaproteobacteria bacterium]
MSVIQDYHSRLSDSASRKFGTFSYLPPMSAQDLRRQVEYLLAQGWAPAIEHAEPQHATGSYWYMWKLPMFGETSADKVLAEAEACRKANPGNHVRLVGYDKLRQTQGTALVIHRGTAA